MYKILSKKKGNMIGMKVFWYLKVFHLIRYKLDVEVEYEDTKSTFVLWDREVTILLGINVVQLRSNMIQVCSKLHFYIAYLRKITTVINRYIARYRLALPIH